MLTPRDTQWSANREKHTQRSGEINPTAELWAHCAKPPACLACSHSLLPSSTTHPSPHPHPLVHPSLCYFFTSSCTTFCYHYLSLYFNIRSRYATFFFITSFSSFQPTVSPFKSFSIPLFILPLLLLALLTLSILILARNLYLCCSSSLYRVHLQPNTLIYTSV